MAKPERRSMLPRARRAAIGGALVLAAAATGIGWQLSNARATPPERAPSPAAAASTPVAASTPGAAAPAPAGSPTAAPDGGSAANSTTARIEFSTVPGAYASVTWGSKLLGRIAPHRPLVVVRPRDSGPLDVIVRAHGFLPVHTRAHTFADSKVEVKLTRPEDKNTLFGYREPLDAGVPDAGALALPPGMTGQPFPQAGQNQQPPPALQPQPPPALQPQPPPALQPQPPPALQR